MSYNYIPDMTERFPEGMDGVDMTPSFFGGTVDWSRAYGYEPSYEEIMRDEEFENENQPKKPYKFEVGKTYCYESLYGGMVSERVIERTETTITVGEYDFLAEMDGINEREPQTFNIQLDENGNEFVEVYYDEYYDYHAKFCANVPDGFNPL